MLVPMDATDKKDDSTLFLQAKSFFANFRCFVLLSHTFCSYCIPLVIIAFELCTSSFTQSRIECNVDC